MIPDHSQSVVKRCAGLVRVCSVVGFVLVFSASFLLFGELIGIERMLLDPRMFFAVATVCAIIGLGNYHLSRFVLDSRSVRNGRVASFFNLAGWSVFVFAGAWVTVSFFCVRRSLPNGATFFWYPWSQLPAILTSGLLGGCIVAARAVWPADLFIKFRIVSIIPGLTTMLAGILVGVLHVHFIPASTTSAIFWGIVTAAVTVQICARLWQQDNERWRLGVQML